jgi:hypothetical protein
MAQVVQLELMVDEKGAVQGVRAFDTAIKTGTGSVQQLNQELAAAGATATATGRQASTALRAVHQESLSTREGVHLLTEEFGIEMPRAFRTLIAQSKAAEVAIKAVGSGIVALGAIQVGVMVFQQIAEGAEKAYDKWITLKSALEDVDEVLKGIQQDAAAATKSQIAATEQYIQLTQGAAAADRYRLQQLQAKPIDMSATYSDEKFKKLSDNMKGAFESITGESVMPKDLDATIAKVHEYNAGLERHIQDVNNATAARNAQVTSLGGRQTLPEIQDLERTGSQLSIGQGIENDLKKHQGDIAMQAKLIGAEIDKATSDEAKKGEGEAKKNASEREAREREFAQIHERAVEAALRGSALYHQQEAAAIEDLKQRHLDTAQAVEDVHARFHAEEMKRLQDESNEVRKAREQTAMGGLTGAARVQQEGRNRVNDIYATANTRSPGATLALIHNADQQTAQELGALQQDFGQRVDELVRSAADRTLSGFAKIHADADKQIADLRKLAGTDHGSSQNRSRGEAAIRRSEGAEVVELQNKYSDETAKIEAQAQARSMSAEKQQTLALQAELAERLRLYEEEHDKQGLSDEDFERRQAAAWQEYNAGMVEQSRRAREKMAGEFSQFFRNPTEALKNMGDHMAGEAAASMVQRVQNHFGGVGGEQQDHSAGGIFDRIAGTPRGSAGADHHAETFGRNPGSTGMISLASAQIRVGSASIVLGGGVGASSGAGGGSFSSGSGTSIGSSGLNYETSGRTLDASGLGGSSMSDLSAFRSSAPNVVGPNGESAANPAAGGPISSTMGSTLSSPAIAATGGGNPVGAAIGNVQQGMSFFKEGKGIFGKHGGKQSDAAAGYAETESPTINGQFDKDGNFVEDKQSGFSKSMLGGGGVMANAEGAAGGAMGLFSSFEGNGGVGGALSGAMSGMQLGMSVGGPIGAGIGAAAGAVMGAFGFGGREKARVYDLKQVRPRMNSDVQGLEQGGDYLSLYSDLQSLDVEAKKTTSSFGPAAGAYYNDTIKKELQQAEAHLTSMQKAGRSQYSSTPAEAAGGWDNVPHDGWAVIHANERVIPGDQNERITRAVEAGASAESVARGYRSTMQSADARQQSSGGSWSGDLHVHAIDAKSGVQWIMNNKHIIRSAVNQSFAENSGGSDFA